MEFPITELLDYENSVEWIFNHFHPKGLKCPKCQKGLEQSRKFRNTRTSELEVYRCKDCGTIYNLYTGTVFQYSQWTPRQVVLLMRGICKGETTRELAAELQLNYKTVLTMRHRVQANAELEQPKAALPDKRSETDEMFQNAGEKRQTTPRSRGSASKTSQQTTRTRNL
jgi:transposase-like protein